MPAKGQINDHAFDRPMSREARYWTGFLMADGCVSSSKHHQNTIQVHLHGRDVQHLHKLRDFLGSDNKIHSNPNDCAFGFSSEQIAENLKYCGVVQQKSTKEIVHDSLSLDRDFWRGAVDGDGSVFITEKRKRLYPFLQLCGSEDLVEQFRQFVISLVGSCSTIHYARKVPYVVISSMRAKTTIEYLYSEGRVSLNRKQIIANQCLTWEPRQLSRCL